MKISCEGDEDKDAEPSNGKGDSEEDGAEHPNDDT